MKRTLELPDQITFSVGKVAYVIPTADVPDASLVAILSYGTRKCNDAVNGRMHAQAADGYKGKQVTKAQATDTWLDAFRDGKLGTRSGGFPRLSDLEKELRAQVHAIMVAQCGYKSGQATKLLSKNGASATFAVFVAKPLGHDTDATETAWTKMVAHAEGEIAKRAAGPGLPDLFDDVTMNDADADTADTNDPTDS